jgi:hypothetical protein
MEILNGNFEWNLNTFIKALHRNRRAAGSIPAQGTIVAFFATVPG